MAEQEDIMIDEMLNNDDQQNDNQADQILNSTEQIVLATALKSPNALPDILSHLSDQDFFRSNHKLIFKAIEDLNAAGNEVSEITVADYLNKQNKLGAAGGNTYIMDLGNKYYTDENIETYIAKVYEASKSRQFKAQLASIDNLARDSKDMKAVLEAAQTKLLDINFDYKNNDTVQIGKAAKEVIAETKKLSTSKDKITGISTGFRSLDSLTAGLQPEDFIILAARPSMGKTAFALNLAYNAANDRRKNNAVAIFSLEMPAKQLTQRILSMVSNVESTKIRTGQKIDNKEWDELTMAQDQLNKTKIFIDDSAGITVQQIQSKLYKLKRDEGVDLCIIDYLQLISSPEGSNPNDRQNEISTISRQLKRIARDTGITIVCLSQLSRSVEKREDKRPIMSDLRDSGAIEQDADIVMFLYREEYYQNKTEEEAAQDNISPTELIISKHRNGPTGVVELSFMKKFGKFVDSN